MERKVDLGCGLSKPEGFIGIDRMAMPGVDLIGDLDGTLPLETDSVDLLYASHSLEHAKDIMHTMREIYRVCKHGAQVCIVAPYYEQKLNLANPYHLNVFNEHTPRFWTKSPVANVDPAEYWHPYIGTWGLSDSDHSDAGMDFRLARMEFFYFPDYLGMNDEERIEARRKYLDVCDQVIYHLVCWKPKQATREDELGDIISSMKLFEPRGFAIRRQHDSELQKTILKQGGYVNKKVGREDLDKLQEKFHELHAQFGKFERDVHGQQSTAIQGVEARLEAERTKSATYSAQIQELGLALDAERRKGSAYESQVQELKEQFDAERAKGSAYQSQVQELEGKFDAERTRGAGYRSEIQDLKDAVDWHRSNANSAEASVVAYGEMLEKAWVDGIANAHELSLFRRRRIIRLLDRLGGADMRVDLHAGFDPLLSPFSEAARVCCGPDLRLSAFISYRMTAPISRPVAIEVALLQTIDNLEEMVGVEVVDKENRIVWNGVRKIDGKCKSPVRFPVDFQLASYRGEIEVRFFTTSKTGPVHPLEVLEGRFSRRRVLGRWCY